MKLQITKLTKDLNSSRIDFENYKNKVEKKDNENKKFFTDSLKKLEVSISKIDTKKNLTERDVKKIVVDGSVALLEKNIKESK